MSAVGWQRKASRVAWSKAVVSFLFLFIAVNVLSVHSRDSVQIVSDYGHNVVGLSLAVVVAAVVVCLSRDRIVIITATIVALLGYSSATLIPYFSGHLIHGRSDTIAHFSDIFHISTSGWVSEKLFYPFFHTLSAEIVIVFDISPAQAMYLTILVLSLLGIVFLALLYRQITSVAIWLGVVIGSAVLIAFPFNIYHISYYPAGLGLFLFPVSLFVAYTLLDSISRMKAIAYRRQVVLFLIIGVALLFVHPISAVMVVLLAGVIFTYGMYRGSFRGLSVGVFILLGFSWYWHLGIIQQSLVTSLMSFVTPEDGSTQTESAISELPVVEFLALKYGNLILLLGVTAIFAYLVLVSNRDRMPTPLKLLIIWGVLAGLAGVGMMFGSSLVGPLRVVDGSVAIWISLLAAGYLAIEYGERVCDGYLRFAVIPLIAILIATSTLFAIPSPATYQYEWDITYQDRNTAEWVGESTDKPVQSVGLPERTLLTVTPLAEWDNSEYRDRFETASNRDHISPNREPPPVYSMDPTDRTSVTESMDGELVIISDWNVRHANDEQLMDTRTFPQIAPHLDSSGVASFEQHANKIHTNGQNSVYA